MSISQARTFEPMCKPGRVVSLDVLRGLTIALMILVNDAGDGAHHFEQLEHADWNGCTLTDLVFPTFLFLVGASMFYSMETREARGDCKKTLAGHVIVRAGKIFLLDLVLAFFPRMHWGGLRLFGVLTRIALCSLFAGLILVATRKAKIVAGITAALLIGYWVLLRWVPIPGVGMPGRDVPFMDEVQNLTSWIDRGFTAWTQHWLHTGVLYRKVRDPEGLLSTLPAIGTTLLGALTGMWMKRSRLNGVSATRMRGVLALAGVASILAGEIWSRWFPLNKNLWTSSYVLLAAGIAMVAVAACSWFVDERFGEWPAWRRAATTPWLIFGSNAIVAYAVSAIVAKTLLSVHIAGADGHQRTLWSVVYRGAFARNGSDNWTSLFFALAFVAICFLPNLLLWRKRIFLKL